jgi:dTDP-4-dehydrorhamnose reductase
VFDGELDRPYSESDVPHPLNVYGASKLAGELAVQQVTKRHIILRTSWLFSEHSPNFVSTILKLASSQKELKVVSDQKGGPTSASSVAKLLLRMVKYYREKGELNWGVYHFACEPYCTWYEFAEAILGMAKQRGLINQIPLLTPILSHEYASPATRPLNSMLKNGNVQRDFGVPCCDWRVELEETLQKATLLVS